MSDFTFKQTLVRAVQDQAHILVILGACLVGMLTLFLLPLELFLPVSLVIAAVTVVLYRAVLIAISTTRAQVRRRDWFS